MVKLGRAGAIMAVCAVLGGFRMPTAQSPLQVIKESNRKVMAIVGEAGRGAKDVDARVGAALDEITDFPRISRLILEKHRGRLTPAQFGELDGLLRQVLRATLVRKLKRLQVDRLLYIVESINGPSARVKTAAYYEGEKYDLDYRLELIEGRWIVVDYVFDSVGAVENYRRQFDELFEQEPYEKILVRLRKKLSAEPSGR